MPLWWESMSWLNIVCVFLETPRDHLLQHHYCNLKDIRVQRWQIWWISLTWCIWHRRNWIVFSNDSFKGHKLMDDALFFCWTWLKNLEKGFDIPFHYWSSKIRDGFCARGGLAYRYFVAGCLAYSQIYGCLIVLHVLGHHSFA